MLRCEVQYGPFTLTMGRIFRPADERKSPKRCSSCEPVRHIHTERKGGPEREEERKEKTTTEESEKEVWKCHIPLKMNLRTVIRTPSTGDSFQPFIVC